MRSWWVSCCLLTPTQTGLHKGLWYALDIIEGAEVCVDLLSIVGPS